MYIITKRKFADGVNCAGIWVSDIKGDEPETIRKFFLDFFYTTESKHILSFQYIITAYKITENILDYEGV